MSDAKSRPSTTHSVAKSRTSTSVSGVSRHTSPQYDVTRENSAYPASQADKQAEAPPGDYYARKAVMFTGESKLNVIFPIVLLYFYMFKCLCTLTQVCVNLSHIYMPHLHPHERKILGISQTLRIIT